MVVKVKIHDVKKKVLLYLCNHDAAPNKDIEEALDIKGAYITRALQQLEPYVTTTLGKGNIRHRSLKEDRVTFAELLGMFVETEYAEEFLKSAYVGEINNPEIYLIVANTIFDKFKTVHLVCDTFYPDSSLAETLDVIFAPDRFGDLLSVEQTCDMCAAALSAGVDRSTYDVDTITNAIMNELTNDVDNVTSAAKNMFNSELKPHVHAYVTGLVSERLRWDAIDRGEPLPPPKIVQ